jgi:predicted ABC-type ATPase
MEGGHDVSIRKIIARYTRSLANCPVAARLADRHTFMTIPSKMPPVRLLFRMADGLLIKNYGNINP